MENWKDRKVLVFPHKCLVKGVERWEVENFFVWFERKVGGWKM